jgi:molybdopterin synthase catalytic subunit
MIAVTDQPIDVDVVLRSVEGRSEGAVVLFVGRVRDRSRERDVTQLDYEAYGAMAEAELSALAETACREHGATRVALVHRVGRLEIGDAAVAVAVSSSHRPEAFAACRWLIDTLKERVPIWKKEHYSDGEEWIAEHP